MASNAGKLILGILGGALLLVVTIAFTGLVLGFPVMWLWNWLMPMLFGLITINFWQACGLVMLCWILFKAVIPERKNKKPCPDKM